MKPFIHSALYVAKSENKGWGVFANAKISESTIIECSPVIIMSSDEQQLLDRTLLHDYIFEWGQDSQRCAMAMGYAPIYNHAVPSNAEYVMMLDQGLITIHAMRDILENEEIFINYQGDFDNDTPVWFEVK